MLVLRCEELRANDEVCEGALEQNCMFARDLMK